jgi:hypothetical protein
VLLSLVYNLNKRIYTIYGRFVLLQKTIFLEARFVSLFLKPLAGFKVTGTIPFRFGKRVFQEGTGKRKTERFFDLVFRLPDFIAKFFRSGTRRSWY